jgi:hypothetical protein
MITDKSGGGGDSSGGRGLGGGGDSSGGRGLGDSSGGGGLGGNGGTTSGSVQRCWSDRLGASPDSEIGLVPQLCPGDGASSRVRFFKLK